jgi:hypothetical protein
MQEEKTLISITSNNDDELTFRLDIEAILDLGDLDAIFMIKSRLDQFKWKLNSIIDAIITSDDKPDCENCENKDTCEKREDCQKDEDDE